MPRRFVPPDSFLGFLQGSEAPPGKRRAGEHYPRRREHAQERQEQNARYRRADDERSLPFAMDDPLKRGLASENDPGQKGAKVMQCLVCGEWKPAVERLQLKIKGIPGGQMAGTSLISANADAFTSYGLSASLIAPTCASCGEEFTKAANELLASEQTCVRTPGTSTSWKDELSDVTDDLATEVSVREPGLDLGGRVAGR